MHHVRAIAETLLEAFGDQSEFFIMDETRPHAYGIRAAAYVVRNDPTQRKLWFERESLAPTNWNGTRFVASIEETLLGALLVTTTDNGRWRVDPCDESRFVMMLEAVKATRNKIRIYNNLDVSIIE